MSTRCVPIPLVLLDRVPDLSPLPSTDAQQEEVTRFEEGQENAHLATDGKDQRSMANKVRRRFSSTVVAGVGS